MKQSESGFCLGFLKLSVEKVEKNPKLLRDYFKNYSHCPEFIVQEAVEGFTRNWETRCFWFNGKFLYAIANKAAVSSNDGKEHIVTGNDIPALPRATEDVCDGAPRPTVDHVWRAVWGRVCGGDGRNIDRTRHARRPCFSPRNC